MIDTGVLGLPTPPPREPKIAADAIVDVVAAEDGGEAAVDAEVMRDESWAAGFAPDLGGADDGEGSRGVGSGGGYSPAGFRADAEFDVRVTGPEEGGGAGELTVRGEGRGVISCHVAAVLGGGRPWLGLFPGSSASICSLAFRFSAASVRAVRPRRRRCFHPR